MTLPFNSSITAIKAAFGTLSASAHNTANINTDGFKKERTILGENKQGGVSAKTGVSKEAGTLYQNSDGKMVEDSNVEISEEIANQMLAKHLLSANIAVLKTTNDIEKDLINILA
jgi:flagellar basal-body rod protein FlgC